MRKREFTAALCLLPLGAAVWAQTQPGIAALAGVSRQDAAAALRQALEQAARDAVRQLGRPDGFWADARYRIGLPPGLRDAEPLLRRLGQGGRVDELLQAMNRAAEQAVPEAQTLLLAAVRALSLEDARRILTGGETAGTAYFSEKTRPGLQRRFEPIVQAATERVQLGRAHDELMAPLASHGLVPQEQARLHVHVTRKALDALFEVMADFERRLRRDPLAAGSALLQRVYGALRP
ncbi:MAG: DUF4197 domain-containing protein [Hylemonella sp.]